jgi:hypothetical protein
MPGYARQTAKPSSPQLMASYFASRFRRRRTEIPFEVDVSLAVGPKVYFDTRVDDGPVKVRQVRWPVLSPDGTKLAFTALDKLYVRDLATGSNTRLAEMPAGQFAPAWSPDSKWIAFVMWSEEEGGHLYKVAITGRSSTPQRLSTISAFYDEPVWTPDGNEIVVAKGPWQQRRALSYFNFIPARHGPGAHSARSAAPQRALRRIRNDTAFCRQAGPSLSLRGEDGLISMRLDGTDRKVHVKVTSMMRRSAVRNRCRR